MNESTFNELALSPEIMRAIEDIGFTEATEIQKKSIPIIKQGLDIIGKSQTGTGKTLAFGIPALELIDIYKNEVQVLILCPTRELAVQAAEELIKLSKFKKGIKIADIYGGAPMERQILKLKTANIVIGTPGRVMDHLRRRTLKLENLKMIVLDEADEMLSMGFREDIESILSGAPEDRQTILFSATMPHEIMLLTKKFQKDPRLIEINRQQVTVENISQVYYNVPSSKKMDTLSILLQYYCPKRSMIFCNTKKMVDIITEHLQNACFDVEGLHGDMKQSQRTTVMNSFKRGKTKILVATDVAARGIDVNDIDYVINYDIPQNTEYYVHRIGRTGRAGKTGMAITICGGIRQAEVLLRIAKLVKVKINYKKLPNMQEILNKQREENIKEIEEKIKNLDINNNYNKILLEDLNNKNCDINQIVLALFELYFGEKDKKLKEIEKLEIINNKENNFTEKDSYRKIVINIGKIHRVAPNHVVGAITEAAKISGREIGKIEILDRKTIVDVPSRKAINIAKLMENCKICGTPTVTTLLKNKEIFTRNNFNSRFTRGRRR